MCHTCLLVMRQNILRELKGRLNPCPQHVSTGADLGGWDASQKTSADKVNLQSKRGIRKYFPFSVRPYSFKSY